MRIAYIGGRSLWVPGEVRAAMGALAGLGKGDHTRSVYSRARLAQTNSRSFLAKTCLYA